MEQVTTQQFYRTRLFVFTLIVVAAGAAFAGVGVFSLLPSRLGSGYGSVLNTIKDLEAVMVQKMVVLYVVISIGIVIAMIYLHLFYSHRVAGPAYRLRKEAEKISLGNLSGNIKFRQKDNMTDMADSLNAVASRYRDRIGRVKREIAAMEAQTETLAAMIAQGKSGAPLETIAENIDANIKSIDAVLSDLRT